MSEHPIPGNPAHALLQRTRRSLLIQLLLRALLWALAAALLVLALGRIGQPWLSFNTQAGFALAALAALLAATVVLWHGRAIRQPTQVALWLEHRLPTLRYALLALLEPQAQTTTLQHQLHTALTTPITTPDGHSQTPQQHLRRQLGQRLRQQLAMSLLVLLLATLLHAIATAGWHQTLAARWQAAATLTGSHAATDRFAPLEGELTPPAYTGWPVQTLEQVDTIGGLTGSQIVLHGQGSSEGITATIEQAGAASEYDADADNDTTATTLPVALTTDANHWQARFSLPQQPATLTLTDSHSRRLIVLAPQADGVPQVRLHLPERDATITDTNGTLELSASLSDDIALARGWFEIIVANGETEGNFTFETRTLLETDFHTSRGELRTQMPLNDFGLKPGGQLSIRAVGSDGNTLTGPGIGYSETRTIRMARAEAEDEVDITPAPPALEQSLMSLRMLIRSTERLDARQGEMVREAFVAEATPLARHADDIRDKVQGFVDDASQGGAFEVPPLLNVALEAMWEGARHLSIADTGAALPELRRAYDALQALANLTRYYFRGEAMPAHADVEGVRMTGEEYVAATPRSQRERQDTPRQRLAARLPQLQQLLAEQPEAAQEPLALLHATTLHELPEAAPLLAQTLQALRSQQDANAPLHALRQQLEGTPRPVPGLPLWAPPLESSP